jgi:hypothetical protein
VNLIMADKTRDHDKKAESESSTRRGEEITIREGKEAGRRDTAPQGPSQRPTGTSTGRDLSGVGPEEDKNPNRG